MNANNGSGVESTAAMFYYDCALVVRSARREDALLSIGDLIRGGDKKRARWKQFESYSARKLEDGGSARVVVQNGTT